MKRLSRSFTLAVLGLVGMMAQAQGSIITTSTATPSPGDFASDSINALDAMEASNQLRVRNNFDAAGQSFTLGTTGDDDYQLNSITFKASGSGGSATESTAGLNIRLYEGTPAVAGSVTEFTSGATTTTTPFFEFTFGAGTFDTTANSYITFEFTPAEIAAIGNLTAGTEYAFSVGVDPAAETTDIDFRFVRDEDNGYANGTSFLSNRVLNGAPGEDINSDLAFVVNATAVTAVPEPSSAVILGLAAFGCICRRRRS